ncbi:hypothetical protein JCGZ_09261 [Jatropha curcas]|uniref:Uncharacterized protein n=1 Tax=Jatropha curcas TaxID=180498 RepID=A0A067KIX6_JATCU|nr:hypothetical protein JCGZ_09261 [Jatropha curcas]
MLVLKKRIKEMKMVEANYEEEAPSNWMEWEKQYYYANYISDVCEALGILQSILINTRPSLALGIFAVLMLSLPTSILIIVLNFWSWINGL